MQGEVRQQVGKEWTEEYAKEYKEKVRQVIEEVLQERKQHEEAGEWRTKDFLRAWKQKQEKDREETRIEVQMYC